MKNPLLYLLCLLTCVFYVSLSFGQDVSDHSFPKGFHIGLTGQGNVAQKMSVIPLSGTLPIPKAYPTMGWNAGVEFSYHFAKHYGILASLQVGTAYQYKYSIFEQPINSYFPPDYDRSCEIQIPLKFEFHQSICNNNWYFYGAIGANFLALPKYLYYLSSGRDARVADELCMSIRVNGLEQDSYVRLYDENGYKLKIDAQLNLGIYYRLPYNDLIRFGVGANLSFQDKLKGFYMYRHQENEFGAMSYRHNYIGLDLAYIHCFKTREQRVAAKKEIPKYSDFSNTVHSLMIGINQSVSMPGTIRNRSGLAVSSSRSVYIPELSLKYSCSFAKRFGFSVQVPLGVYQPYYKVDLSESIPADTVWSNGATGLKIATEGKVGGIYTGFSLMANYTKEIHPNIILQPEMGLSWKWLFNTLGRHSQTAYNWVTVMYGTDANAIPIYRFTYMEYPKKNWIPNLSGALNFLVHGRNPQHNFVFGLNFNVDFSKRMTIDYATVPSFPAKYQSSGQVAFNMTTIGVHVGYQFMTGRRRE